MPFAAFGGFRHSESDDYFINPSTGGLTPHRSPTLTSNKLFFVHHKRLPLRQRLLRRRSIHGLIFADQLN